MSPRLGASLPIRSTLGYSDNCQHRPGVGNGFDLRFAEDLTLVAELGVTDLRLGVDWSRLQPTATNVNSDWREWYLHVLDAGRAAGVAIWLNLLEGPVPRWFDDEGGFADAKAAGRAWPRWVEVCTELFGDSVAGWYPIHDPIGIAAAAAEDGSPRHLDAIHHLVVAWRDAWRILRGGPPVATSLGLRLVRAADESEPARLAARREDHLRWTLWMRALRDGVVSVPTRAERPVADLAGSLDVLGVAFGTDVAGITVIGEGTVGPWEDRAGTILRRVAEEGPSRPITVTYRARLADDDHRGVCTEAFARAVTHARRDGIDLTTVFWSPAIDGSTDTTGPITIDRDLKGSATVWPTLATPETPTP